MKDQAQMTLHGEDNATGLVLYMAMELSEKKWKLAFSDGVFKPNGQLRVYQKSIEGNDWVSLAAVLERAKRDLRCPVDTLGLIIVVVVMAAAVGDREGLRNASKQLFQKGVEALAQALGRWRLFGQCGKAMGSRTEEDAQNCPGGRGTIGRWVPSR
jgi:hypothetical protein